MNNEFVILTLVCSTDNNSKLPVEWVHFWTGTNISIAIFMFIKARLKGYKTINLKWVSK